MALIGAEMDVEGLYMRWRVCLNAYFAKRVGVADAEDLTQELFVRFLGAQAKGTEIVLPRRWLWRVARNLVTDVYRDRARCAVWATFDGAEDADVVDRWAADPLELTMEWGDRVDVARCLPLLTPVQLEAVVLRHRNGWRHQQVADAVGIPLGAAKARHRRAVDRLRELLGDLG